MYNHFKKFLWITPFISFMGGYLIFRAFFHIEDIETPSLIGKSLEQAIVALSSNNLNPRLLGKKEEPDLPENTIINQTPRAGQKIKPYQSVFLVLSKKQAKKKAPELINKPLEVIKKLLEQEQIHAKLYFIPSHYPKGHCFGQIPGPQEELDKNSITLYIATNFNKPILWPNFIHKPVQEVVGFLEEHSIEPQIISYPGHHINYNLGSYNVIDQRPQAGSLLTLDQKHMPYVQLYVK